MQTVTSVSGGRTSAYLAANYPSDHLLFALVRIEDENCRFKDEKVRQYVEDRIQAPFIATAEDDMIIYTMLDLEQFLGQKINWVTGMTYDQLIKQMGGYLPNIQARGCTTELKLIPMAQWILVNIGEPVLMQIGFRANETNRANSALEKLNINGFSEIKIPIAHKLRSSSGKWRKVNKVFEWQRPEFRLIEDGIFKQDISSFWEDKPVNFADYNNCVGCFHRQPLFLAKMVDVHPKKMDWFAGKETIGTWKKGITYNEIKKMRVQRTLSFEDLGGCASGFCDVL